MSGALLCIYLDIELRYDGRVIRWPFPAAWFPVNVAGVAVFREFRR